MSKIYIAYRFSRVAKEQLNELIHPILDILKRNGCDAFCNYNSNEMYIEQNYSLKDIMNHCYANLDERDIILCLIDTNELSCGMLLELGYAFAKEKEIIVCARKGCEISTIEDMVDKHYTYDSYETLQTIINELTWNQILL